MKTIFDLPEECLWKILLVLLTSKQPVITSAKGAESDRTLEKEEESKKAISCQCSSNLMMIVDSGEYDLQSVISFGQTCKRFSLLVDEMPVWRDACLERWKHWTNLKKPQDMTFAANEHEEGITFNPLQLNLGQNVLHHQQQQQQQQQSNNSSSNYQRSRTWSVHSTGSASTATSIYKNWRITYQNRHSLDKRLEGFLGKVVNLGYNRLYFWQMIVAMDWEAVDFLKQVEESLPRWRNLTAKYYARTALHKINRRMLMNRWKSLINHSTRTFSDDFLPVEGFNYQGVGKQKGTRAAVSSLSPGRYSVLLFPDVESITYPNYLSGITSSQFPPPIEEGAILMSSFQYPQLDELDLRVKLHLLGLALLGASYQALKGQVNFESNNNGAAPLCCQKINIPESFQLSEEDLNLVNSLMKVFYREGREKSSVTTSSISVDDRTKSEGNNDASSSSAFLNRVLEDHLTSIGIDCGGCSFFRENASNPEKLISFLEQVHARLFVAVKRALNLHVRRRRTISACTCCGATVECGTMLRIKLLNWFLFDKCKFQSSDTLLEAVPTHPSLSSFELGNCFLPDLLENRMGVPVAMCILYSCMGRYLGLNSELVNFPQSCLVAIRNDTNLTQLRGCISGSSVKGRSLELEEDYRYLVAMKGYYFVDPFCRGKVMAEEYELREMLREIGIVASSSSNSNSPMNKDLTRDNNNNNNSFMQVLEEEEEDGVEDSEGDEITNSLSNLKHHPNRRHHLEEDDYERASNPSSSTSISGSSSFSPFNTAHFHANLNSWLRLLRNISLICQSRRRGNFVSCHYQVISQILLLSPDSAEYAFQKFQLIQNFFREDVDEIEELYGVLKGGGSGGVSGGVFSNNGFNNGNGLHNGNGFNNNGFNSGTVDINRTREIDFQSTTSRSSIYSSSLPNSTASPIVNLLSYSNASSPMEIHHSSSPSSSHFSSTVRPSTSPPPPAPQAAPQSPNSSPASGSFPLASSSLFASLPPSSPSHPSMVMNNLLRELNSSWRERQVKKRLSKSREECTANTSTLTLNESEGLPFFVGQCVCVGRRQVPAVIVGWDILNISSNSNSTTTNSTTGMLRNQPPIRISYWVLMDQGEKRAVMESSLSIPTPNNDTTSFYLQQDVVELRMHEELGKYFHAFCPHKNCFLLNQEYRLVYPDDFKWVEECIKK